MSGRDTAIALLVKRKSTAVLEFPASWPATAENGEQVSVSMLIRTTVENCIHIQRHQVSLSSSVRKPATDHELLDAFLAQPWRTATPTSIGERATAATFADRRTPAFLAEFQPGGKVSLGLH